MNAMIRRFGESVAWGDLLRGEGLAWLFVAKIMLASLSALWLALRFGLPQPYTAMLTVFVVMRPQSGLVLAKSFYRAIGTLAGAAAILLLYALLPQQRVLFLLGLALWVSACTFGAARYRNFAAYAFVLSGYTACIIGLPAVSAPTDIFEDAVARVSEVMLGILCAGVVSDVIFPQRLRDALVRGVRARFVAFVRYSHDALTGTYDHARIEARWRDFVIEAIGLEAQRSSTIFENPQTRARSAMVQRLNLEFMDANTRLLRLHHWMHRLRQQRGSTGEVPRDAAVAAVVTAVETLYQPLATALDVDLDAHTGEHARDLALSLSRFSAALPAQSTRLREGLPARVRPDLDVALTLLDDYARALRRYASTYATLRSAPVDSDAAPASRRHRFVPHTDTLVDLVAGVSWAGVGAADRRGDLDPHRMAERTGHGDPRHRVRGAVQLQPQSGRVAALSGHRLPAGLGLRAVLLHRAAAAGRRLRHVELCIGAVPDGRQLHADAAGTGGDRRGFQHHLRRRGGRARAAGVRLGRHPQRRAGRPVLRIAGTGVAVHHHAGGWPLDASAHVASSARLCGGGLHRAAARPACATGNGAA
ncbi:hypothetical protein UU5_10116 [Rhodanobacter sp. 115]|nr:hypothetical protein UU5_10116 [Rhodanobacter sp. 115]